MGRQRTILAGEGLQIENIEGHWEIVKMPVAAKELPRLGISER
jgi:hypothetical protein